MSHDLAAHTAAARPAEGVGASADEIEITPEMIEAGRDEAFDLDAASVVRIYTAMESERRRSHREKLGAD